MRSAFASVFISISSCDFAIVLLCFGLLKTSDDGGTIAAWMCGVAFREARFVFSLRRFRRDRSSSLGFLSLTTCTVLLCRFNLTLSKNMGM
jgi:hypothetical protein